MDAQILQDVPMFTRLEWPDNPRRSVIKIGSTFGYLTEPSESGAWQRDTAHNWEVKPGRKPQVRDMSVTPFCTACKVNHCATSTHEGKKYFRKYCHTCADKKYKDVNTVREMSRVRTATRHAKFKLKKMAPCTVCGFMPQVAAQMDWDHADGNRNNNDDSNLRLLCANCHRLKTWENNDFDYTRYQKEDNFMHVAQ